MSELTGLPFPVVAFDWDGTLTNQGVTAIGHGNPGLEINLDPVQLMLDHGCAVGIMTCNVVTYVGNVLRTLGFAVRYDPAMTIKIWDGGPDRAAVLVTSRKLLADLYPDDHGYEFHYGDDPRAMLAKVLPCYHPEGDGCVPAVKER